MLLMGMLFLFNVGYSLIPRMVWGMRLLLCLLFMCTTVTHEVNSFTDQCFLLIIQGIFQQFHTHVYVYDSSGLFSVPGFGNQGRKTYGS